MAGTLLSMPSWFVDNDQNVKKQNKNKNFSQICCRNVGNQIKDSYYLHITTNALFYVNNCNNYKRPHVHIHISTLAHSVTFNPLHSDTGANKSPVIILILDKPIDFIPGLVHLFLLPDAVYTLACCSFSW